MHENHASIVALHRLKPFFKKSAETFASTQYNRNRIPTPCIYQKSLRSWPLFFILKWILGLSLLYVNISSVLEQNQFLKKSFQQHLSKSHYDVNR